MENENKKLRDTITIVESIFKFLEYCKTIPNYRFIIFYDSSKIDVNEILERNNIVTSYSNGSRIILIDKEETPDLAITKHLFNVSILDARTLGSMSTDRSH